MATQSDTLIGPIITQLTAIAQQITDIGTIYAELPEAAPEDNSVMFACRHIDVNSATNGKLDLHFDFDIIHSFRRTRLQNDLARCYAAMPAWADVLSQRANVRMGSSATIEDLHGMDIEQIKWGNQTMIGVVSHIRVRYQFTITA
jgi:hypothetical protein